MYWVSDVQTVRHSMFNYGSIDLELVENDFSGGCSGCTPLLHCRVSILPFTEVHPCTAEGPAAQALSAGDVVTLRATFNATGSGADAYFAWECEP